VGGTRDGALVWISSYLRRWISRIRMGRCGRWFGLLSRREAVTATTCPSAALSMSHCWVNPGVNRRARPGHRRGRRQHTVLQYSRSTLSPQASSGWGRGWHRADEMRQPSRGMDSRLPYSVSRRLSTTERSGSQAAVD
jgi:hypothetical protein